jgi:hypothetical protein
MERRGRIGNPEDNQSKQQTRVKILRLRINSIFVKEPIDREDAPTMNHLMCSSGHLEEYSLVVLVPAE